MITQLYTKYSLYNGQFFKSHFKLLIKLLYLQGFLVAIAIMIYYIHASYPITTIMAHNQITVTSRNHSILFTAY